MCTYAKPVNKKYDIKGFITAYGCSIKNDVVVCACDRLTSKCFEDSFGNSTFNISTAKKIRCIQSRWNEQAYRIKREVGSEKRFPDFGDDGEEEEERTTTEEEWGEDTTTTTLSDEIDEQATKPAAVTTPTIMEATTKSTIKQPKQVTEPVETETTEEERETGIVAGRPQKVYK
ncbi:hypothetical protein Y032_0004g2103 [Ancylostoma ceylanicum]|uniref:Uncharacterized protein n=1 Tax=Ancylostoma ceylanicum TaxID=53326 RepID=A0A016VUQ5_9BILA|nr:hypothetical protein Y032_0004g2103 [Ancylostoma ceylanicum]